MITKWRVFRWFFVGGALSSVCVLQAAFSGQWTWIFPMLIVGSLLCMYAAGVVETAFLDQKYEMRETLYSGPVKALDPVPELPPILAEKMAGGPVKYRNPDKDKHVAFPDTDSETVHSWEGDFIARYPSRGSEKVFEASEHYQVSCIRIPDTERGAHYEAQCSCGGKFVHVDSVTASSLCDVHARIENKTAK